MCYILFQRCAQFVDATRVWDPVSQVAYWYSGDQWVAGEDIESIRAKVRTNVSSLSLYFCFVS